MKLTSSFLKERAINHFEEKSYLACATEFFNNSDVFGLKKSLYTHEVEVKVSKSDLNSELKIIRYLQGDRKEVWKRTTKFYKHSSYLKIEDFKYYTNNYIPNEFSFLIPNELVDFALKTLKNTPYGLYGYGKYKCGYNNSYTREGIHEVKKPQKLNKEKFTTKQLLSLVRRCSWENNNLRRKINDR